MDATAAARCQVLFDHYAPRFEAALVARLGYRVPEVLEQAIRRAMAARSMGQFGRALDLGCGTGLMGERLRALGERLEGVDLSANMLGEVRRKGIYDRLERW